jgi:hypothetical protein
MITNKAKRKDEIVEISTMSQRTGYVFFSAGTALFTINLCGKVCSASTFAS